MQATFRGLEFGVARKAYQNYLYQGGCKTVKFYDVGIKDTAMFTVESPKELWLAYDELKVRPYVRPVGPEVAYRVLTTERMLLPHGRSASAPSGARRRALPQAALPQGKGLLWL